MSKRTTAQMWPAETPEQMIERVRREHGDAVADLVARDLLVTPTRKKQVPKRVGNKPIPRPALSEGMVPRQSPSWDEHLYRGDPENFDPDFVPGVDHRGRKMPRSGAGPLPAVRPRTASERKRA